MIYLNLDLAEVSPVNDPRKIVSATSCPPMETSLDGPPGHLLTDTPATMRQGILRQQLIENGVGNLVTNIVRVDFGNRLRGVEK